MLLAVPNFSEGRERARIDRISAAFATGAALLDTHSDPVHNRTVLTLSGPEGALAGPLANGARACAEEIDMRRQEGAHPCIGALDVCPVVWLRSEARDRARAGGSGCGARGSAPKGCRCSSTGIWRHTRAIASAPSFAPGGWSSCGVALGAASFVRTSARRRCIRRPGATLVTARAPLAAFNVELEGAGVEVAREIAARLRETGGGLAGVRAIGIDLPNGRAQVSTNVHDPIGVPLGAGRRSSQRAGGDAREPACPAPRSSAWSPRPRSSAGRPTSR